jgi:DNA-binding transcriptional regulator YiaG
LDTSTLEKIMRSEEFRQLRMAAGWSVRGAANELGVTPSTIQRWEAGATIPSEAADQVRAAAADHKRLASAHGLRHNPASLQHQSSDSTT